MIQLEYFIDLWGNEEPRYKEQEAFWNDQASQFSNHIEKEDHQEHVKQLVDWLQNNGALQLPGRILDIGCGAGTYAIPFAQAGHEVNGMDISSEMVKYACQNAEKFGVNSKTTFQQGIWEEIDVEQNGWNKAFDLVFASKTPAIRNIDALEKMIRCSRGGCFLSSFVYKRDQIEQRIRAALQMKKKQKPSLNRIYLVFNILWMKGFYPSIHYLDYNWNNEYTLEEAIEHFRLYLRIKPEDDPRLDKIVIDILEEIAAEQGNGVIRQKVEAKLAWIYWSVK